MTANNKSSLPELANAPHRRGLTRFQGSPLSCSESQSDSQRSDGQLQLSWSGNHTVAPVPVPIEGGWGSPSAGAEEAGGGVQLYILR
ncbi:unnamed protein product [Pleuronectes platessa]|uniref:Uncharacterized protein n=1 Tax=Pleuronectes platessa TaxID=8262 RepID=A0A9N7Y3K2_PLEPL|nr:unnamed protein product [Pleuronectes platessa]